MKNKKGFTLVEVILVLVLVVIILGGAISVFAPGFSLFNKSSELKKAKDLANQVMLVIEDYVHDAKTYIGNNCDSYSTDEYDINTIGQLEDKIQINGQIPNTLPVEIYDDYKIDVFFFDGNGKLGVEVKVYDSGKEVYKLNTKMSSQSKDTIYGLAGSEKNICLVFKK